MIPVRYFPTHPLLAQQASLVDYLRYILEADKKKKLFYKTRSVLIFDRVLNKQVE